MASKTCGAPTLGGTPCQNGPNCSISDHIKWREEQSTPPGGGRREPEMADNNAAQNGGNRTNWAPVAVFAILAALVLGVLALWQPWNSRCRQACPVGYPAAANVNVSGTVDVTGTVDVNVHGTVDVNVTGTVAVTVIEPSTTLPSVTTTTRGGGGDTTTSTTSSTTTTVASTTSTTTSTTTTTVTTTTQPNHNPTISVNPEFAEKWAGSNGEACFTFTATVGDIDGDSLTIAWSTGGGGTSTQVCRPVGNGWQISATVYDGRGGSAPDGSTFNVLAGPNG